MPDNIPAT
ncbi:hypothetical protein ECPA38_1234, partial [Escherichia coli PA38]